MGGISGGQSKSSTNSQSSSVDLGSNVWGTQSPYLQNLYELAQGQLGQGQTASTNQNQQYQTQYDALNQFQNPTVDPRMSVYANQIGRNFSEQILPQIQSQAVEAGGLGNSRQQLAQGYAGAQANQQMADFASQLYGENQNRALQSIQMQNQISGQQGQLPWANLQSYQGLLGAPVMQDLGGSSQSTTRQRAREWNAGAKIGK